VVEFWLALASAIIVCGRLLRRAWTHAAGKAALAAAPNQPTGAGLKRSGPDVQVVSKPGGTISTQTDELRVSC
jgi:hypothetical protein